MNQYTFPTMTIHLKTTYGNPNRQTYEMEVDPNMSFKDLKKKVLEKGIGGFEKIEDIDFFYGTRSFDDEDTVSQMKENSTLYINTSPSSSDSDSEYDSTHPMYMSHTKAALYAMKEQFKEIGVPENVWKDFKNNLENFVDLTDEDKQDFVDFAKCLYSEQELSLPEPE
jgi:hypothetical protein